MFISYSQIDCATRKNQPYSYRCYQYSQGHCHSLLILISITLIFFSNSFDLLYSP